MKLFPEQLNRWFLDLPIEEKRWIHCIIMELELAQQKHPNWPDDHIHAAAIINEEAGELIRAAIQYKYEKGRFYDMHKEAIQTGAMALRFLIETGELKLTGRTYNCKCTTGNYKLKTQKNGRQ